MTTIKDIGKLLMSRHKLKGADADRFLQQMVEVINEGLLRDRTVKIKGFGTFKLQAVKERASVNVNTGEKVMIGEHDKVTFTPDSVMKEIINKPFAQFETVVIDDDSPLLKEGGIPEVADDTEEEQEIADVQEVAEIPVEPTELETKEIPKPPEPLDIPDKPIEPETPDEPAPVAPMADIPATPDAHEIPETVEVKAEKVMVVADSVTVVTNDIKNEVKEEKPEETPREEFSQTTDETINIVGTESDRADSQDATEQADNITETTEITDKENEETTESMEDKKCKSCGLLKYAAVAIVFFALGYLVGAEGLFSSLGKRTALVEDSVKMKHPEIKPDTTATEDAGEDAAAVETEQAAQPETKPAASEAQPAPAAKPAAKPAETADKPLTQYNSDNRVKTGAYYIMGTETEVTVKEGQTLSSIAKSYLGPGMECYVEAYNGVKEVKPGQKIKIPKLKMKNLKK